MTWNQKEKKTKWNEGKQRISTQCSLDINNSFAHTKSMTPRLMLIITLICLCEILSWRDSYWRDRTVLLIFMFRSACKKKCVQPPPNRKGTWKRKQQQALPSPDECYGFGFVCVYPFPIPRIVCVFVFHILCVQSNNVHSALRLELASSFSLHVSQSPFHLFISPIPRCWA